MLLQLAAAALPLLAAASGEAGLAAFRPPAIPLLTTDPYMQTWLMGDNSTADVVRHWDQTPKEMMGLLRVGSSTYRYLGACGKPPLPMPTKPGAARVQPRHNICPGSGDISNFPTESPDECNEVCYGTAECTAYVLTRGLCYLKSCTAPVVEDAAATLGVITGERPPEPPPAQYCAVEPLQQLSVTVRPTETLFKLRDAAMSFELTVTFVSSMLANDYERLSRPVYRVALALRPLKRLDGAVRAYLDFSAQHVVNEKAEPVEWSKFYAGSTVNGSRMGTSAQCVLCAKGDKTNINWGYLYLAPVGNGQSRGGSANAQRTAFAERGALPSSPDTNMPRSSAEDMPALSAVANMLAEETGSAAASGSLSAVFVVAYDDIASVRYYGTNFRGFWTQKWSSIEEAIEAAVSPLEVATVANLTETLNNELVTALSAVGGDEFATIGALAYRQTLAATKLTWNDQAGEQELTSASAFLATAMPLRERFR